MSILKVNTVLSDRFSHDVEDKIISCEISTLNNVKFTRLYDDACDLGLELLNPKTNNRTRWYLQKEEILFSGEVAGWIFRPCPESENGNQNMAGYKMIIWND